MKAYITKRALTEGIVEREGVIRVDYPDAFEAIPKAGEYWATFWKPHWHATREEAVARANKMRDSAIKSAEKKIEKLRKLSYETKRN